MHSTRPSPGILSLVVLTSMCSAVWTFGIPKGLSKPSVQTTSSSSLRVSVWEADLIFDLEGDDDNEEEKDAMNKPLPSHTPANQIEIIKYKSNKKKKSKKESWCPFLFFLNGQERSIRDPSERTLHMDDELKRLEDRYHQLAGEDLPNLYYPLGYGFEHYSGGIVRPNERAYELVTRMYSKANLGKEGADYAEDIVQRYEKFNPSHVATTKMMAFVMKAYINAGDLERTEHWMHRIERKYELTQAIGDYPGYYIYNPYVDGLRNMVDVSEKKMAKLSMEVLKKIDTPSKLALEYELFPGRDLYLDIMKYQERGYKGSAAFFRIEEVFRQLQKNYEASNKNPRLKPAIDALTPVFLAAAQCYFPHDEKVVVMANALFDEYDQLYRETGDPDYRPNGTICNSLNSIYARMNRHSMNLADYTDRIVFLIQRMEEYKVNFKDPRDKTATFNRILHAAESHLPQDPLLEPLQTKENFEVALSIFKKFHDSSLQLSPNNATYQIFLRACTKLPDGAARNKLASKAFELCRKNGCVTTESIFKLYTANPEHAIAVLKENDYLGFDRDLFPFAA